MKTWKWRLVHGSANFLPKKVNNKLFCQKLRSNFVQKCCAWGSLNIQKQPSWRRSICLPYVKKHVHHVFSLKLLFKLTLLFNHRLLQFHNIQYHWQNVNFYFSRFRYHASPLTKVMIKAKLCTHTIYRSFFNYQLIPIKH